MNVLFVSQPGHTVLPASGSLELWTDEVARRLARRGHEVVVVASRISQVETARRAGVTYRFVDHRRDARTSWLLRKPWRLLPSDRAFFSSSYYPRAYWREAARAAVETEADVLHVFNYSQAVPVLRRARPGATIVLHMQCEWLTQLDRRMLARRLRDADLVLGSSDHITDAVAARFPEHRDRCRTVYNGVDVDAFASGGGAREPGVVRLLFVGRISPEKGLHTLARAFSALVAERPEVRLTIVGEESPIPAAMALSLSDDPLVQGLAPYYRGSYLEAVRRCLSEEAEARTTFAGRLPHSEALAAYGSADVFVFPSIFESFGIPPVEAMAAGLPVVTTARGGMLETVEHGRTGLLVTPEDAGELAAALRALVDDPGLRRSMGSAGRERAARLFSWEGITDGFETLVRAPRGARLPPRAVAGTASSVGRPT